MERRVLWRTTRAAYGSPLSEVFHVVLVHRPRLAVAEELA
jgi:hypothetical protein